MKGRKASSYVNSIQKQEKDVTHTYLLERNENKATSDRKLPLYQLSLQCTYYHYELTNR